MAEAKARLARAYASPRPPRRLELTPDGLAELWKVGEVVMVIPVVPYDSPAELEFALRLRRDAMLTGQCERCGATPSLELTPVAADPPITRSVFKHRMSCPGRDEGVAPLIRTYRAARAKQDNRERFTGAQKATGSVVEPYKANGLQIRSTEGEQMAQTLLTKLMSADTATRCAHLTPGPYQTWNVFIADGNWRCNECYAYYRANELAGSLSAVEEFTCDICRRYAPATIAPLVIRIDMFVLRGAACGRCFDTYGDTTDNVSDGTTDEMER